MRVLEDDWKKTGLSFMEAKNDPFMSNRPVDNVDLAQRMYMQRMVLTCIRPVMSGLSMDSIIQSVGSYMGMVAVSPEFEGQFKTAVNSAISGFQLGRTEKAYQEAVNTYGDGSEQALALDEKRRGMLMKQNYGRMPLSPRNAGMMQLRFTKQAYNAMREPGADINAVEKHYNEAMDVLYARAERDGVSREAVDLNSRILAGQLIELDPSNRMVFAETSYDGVTMDDKKDKSYDVMEQGGIRRVSHFEWRGEFSNSDGQPFRGCFRPRRPISMDAHLDMYGKTVDSIIDKCDCSSPESVKADIFKSDFRARTKTAGDMMQADGIGEDVFVDALRDRFNTHSNARAAANYEAMRGGKTVRAEPRSDSTQSRQSWADANEKQGGNRQGSSRTGVDDAPVFDGIFPDNYELDDF